MIRRLDGWTGRSPCPLVIALRPSNRPTVVVAAGRGGAYASPMVQANVGAQLNPDPARAQFEHLIEAFGRAWESGRPEAISGVFTPDGALVPSPFDLPIRGRAA